MKKERITAPVSKLSGNIGQLDWLPRNPREWTAEDVERTRRSIVEDEDFLEDRPPLVVEHGNRLVVFAGNLRLTAIRNTAIKRVPVVLYTPETQEDRDTIIRRAIKDNGSFGSWDWDELANGWDDLPLSDWGVPAWSLDKDLKRGLSTKGREGDADYEEFVDKFREKLTTDDCYTPPKVYDAVLAWAREHLEGCDGAKIVRPFYPGGDYTRLDQYAPGCFVVDNPPFSLLAQIIRFYCSNGVRFLLFAPALTLFTARDCDVTYIVTDSYIEYENGAKVRTGFITNAPSPWRIVLDKSLGDAIDAAQDEGDNTKQGFVYPDNIVTAAILGKIVKRGVELKVRKVSCEAVSDSDSAKEQGRGLYGGGFIMSDGAAAERAAAERAAAERAAATRLNLSPREKEIIERLNEADKEFYQTAEKPRQN